jgi:hypothetical protein
MEERLTIGMNIACLKCRHVRMYAQMRGGTATPMFFCPVKDLRHTHLMPGEPLNCREQYPAVSTNGSSTAVLAEALEEHS